MKSINVVAAVIRDGEKILATKRGYGEFENYWEFPGGKIENGETPKDALKREIKEELNASIEIDDFLIEISYDYPDFHLNMDCYLCSLLDDYKLIEHKDAVWITKDEFDDYMWLPADIEVLDGLKKLL